MNSSLPLKPCVVPGCPRLCRGARCEFHSLQQETSRGTSTDRGYDVWHRRLRPLCFERDNWRCVDCGWQPDLVKFYQHMNLGAIPVERVFDELRQRANNGQRHLHMDHIQTIEDRPDLRLMLDNVATRCNVCHNKRSYGQAGLDSRNAFRSAGTT